MTGFARVTGRVSDSLSFTLSLKSVNHRFLDPQLRMPSGLESLEMRIRRLLKEKLVRGHVEFTLSLERNTEKATQYNSALVASYIAAFRAAAAEHALDQQPDLNANPPPARRALRGDLLDQRRNRCARNRRSRTI